VNTINVRNVILKKENKTLKYFPMLESCSLMQEAFISGTTKFPDLELPPARLPGWDSLARL
jgi:hypothetical protein